MAVSVAALTACGASRGSSEGDDETGAAPSSETSLTTVAADRVPGSVVVEMAHRAWTFTLARSGDPDDANCVVASDADGVRAYTWGKVVSQDGTAELEVEYTNWLGETPSETGYLRITAVDGSFEYLADDTVGQEPKASVVGSGAVFDAVLVDPDSPDGATFPVTVRLDCPT